MAIMYANGLCANENYMTREEAAAVTEEQLKPSRGKSIFYDRNIKTFKEFKYFVSLIQIPSECFNSCTSLASIEIPNSVTSIGDYAFYSCKNLGTIRIFATTAPVTSGSAFGDSTSSFTGRNNYDKGTNILYVPSGATGYDGYVWVSILLNSTNCGFTISYTL